MTIQEFWTMFETISNDVPLRNMMLARLGVHEIHAAPVLKSIPELDSLKFAQVTHWDNGEEAKGRRHVLTLEFWTRDVTNVATKSPDCKLNVPVTDYRRFTRKLRDMATAIDKPTHGLLSLWHETAKDTGLYAAVLSSAPGVGSRYAPGQALCMLEHDKPSRTLIMIAHGRAMMVEDWSKCYADGEPLKRNIVAQARLDFAEVAPAWATNSEPVQIDDVS